MSTAPKVTEADIEARIVKTEFHVLPGTTTTVCVLTLDNGWSETGISACVSPENFNEAEGQKWSRLQAFNKLWPLLGFELKTKLYMESSLSFLARLKRERDELVEKHSKLKAFVGSEKFLTLDDEARSDLELQLKAMEPYAFIVSKRYDDLTAEDGA